MIKIENADGLKKILLGDKEKNIGEVLVDPDGLKYIIIKIDKTELRSVSMDELIKMKDKNLQEYLKKKLPENKIQKTLKNIRFYRNDLQQIYA